MDIKVDRKSSMWEGMAKKVATITLTCLMLLPLFVRVNPNFNMLATACLTVFIGCHSSVKTIHSPSHNKQNYILDDHIEIMSKGKAIGMPFTASAVLLCFYFLIKRSYTPMLTSISILYIPFHVMALSALLATILPSQWNERIINCRLSLWNKFHEVELFTKSELVSCTLAIGFYMWYTMERHWLAQNTFCLAWAIFGIKMVSLGSFTNGAILLAGLIIYDVVWVFFMPVMETVAMSSLDLGPLMFLFPVIDGSGRNFAVLGLGDIVIPGLFVALALRFDMNRGGKTIYFASALAGYTTGLLVAIVVGRWFQAAQPALLYIVPGVIGFLGVHCAIRGEIKPLLAYAESKHYNEEDKELQDHSTELHE